MGIIASKMGNCLCPDENLAIDDAPISERKNSQGISRDRLPTSVDQSEVVLWKQRIPEDRFEAKIKQNEKEIADVNSKIKELVATSKRSAAKYQLSRKKILVNSNKNLQDKLLFIQKQQLSIKSAIEEAKFTQVVKESNQVLSKLIQKVDLHQVEHAKELTQESNMMNEQLNELTEDQDFDTEIEDELNELIAQQKYGEDLNQSGNITFANLNKNSLTAQTSNNKLAEKS